MSNGNVDSPGATRASGLDPAAVARVADASALVRVQVTRDRDARLRADDLAGVGLAAAAGAGPGRLCDRHPRALPAAAELHRTPTSWAAARRSHGPTTGSCVDAVADPELRPRAAARDRRRAHDRDRRGLASGSAGSDPAARCATTPAVRPMGVEQSNSSIVFADETVLKVFRRLEPGINPELEMLRFLTEHEFETIAPLQGWYEYEGRSLTATLGVAQQFMAGAVGGWELALDEIGTDPDAFLELARGARRGHGGAAQRARVRRRRSRRSRPRSRASEALALLTATIDEDIERVFLRLPDDERVAPIAGRGEDVREQICQPRPARRRRPADPHPRRLPPRPDPALTAADRGWADHRLRGRAGPAAVRAPPEALAAARRRRACCARSPTPPRRPRSSARCPPRATSSAARARRSSTRYLAEIDPALLPAGDAAIRNLLSIFELEKAVYELQLRARQPARLVADPGCGYHPTAWTRPHEPRVEVRARRRRPARAPSPARRARRPSGQERRR